MSHATLGSCIPIAIVSLWGFRYCNSLPIHRPQLERKDHRYCSSRVNILSFCQGTTITTCVSRTRLLDRTLGQATTSFVPYDAGSEDEALSCDGETANHRHAARLHDNAAADRVTFFCRSPSHKNPPSLTKEA